MKKKFKRYFFFHNDFNWFRTPYLIHRLGARQLKSTFDHPNKYWVGIKFVPKICCLLWGYYYMNWILDFIRVAGFVKKRNLNQMTIYQLNSFLTNCGKMLKTTVYFINILPIGMEKLVTKIRELKVSHK